VKEENVIEGNKLKRCQGCKSKKKKGSAAKPEKKITFQNRAGKKERGKRWCPSILGGHKKKAERKKEVDRERLRIDENRRQQGADIENSGVCAKHQGKRHKGEGIQGKEKKAVWVHKKVCYVEHKRVQGGGGGKKKTSGRGIENGHGRRKSAALRKGSRGAELRSGI